MSAQLHGTTIKWSTIDSPKPFGGIGTNFQYGLKPNVGEVTDEQMALAAVALYGEIGNWSFDATVTDESTDFPDLSEGAKIALDGYEDGTHLFTRAIEKWALNQAKTGSASGIHYPKVTGGAGANAGTFSALSPDQTAPIIRPAGKVVWSTQGMTHTLGKVHAVEIEQLVKHYTEDDEAGDPVFAAVSNYRRNIKIDVLVLLAAAMPVTDAILTVTGIPAHGANSFQVSGDIKFVQGKGAMMTLEGLWAPGLVDEEEEG